MFADSPPQAEPLAAASAELALALDLDFLPERYRRRRLTLAGLRPALFALGFALLLIPLGRYWQEAAGQLAAVEAGLAEVQSALQGYQPLAEERAALEARMAAAQSAASEIQIAYDAVDIQDVTWNRLLTRALSVRPSGVELIRIEQDGGELILEGLAASHLLPSGFADALRGLIEFEEIVLQSVSQVELALDPEAADPQALDASSRDPAAPPETEIVYLFEIHAFLPPPPAQPAP